MTTGIWTKIKPGKHVVFTDEHPIFYGLKGVVLSKDNDGMVTVEVKVTEQTSANYHRINPFHLRPARGRPRIIR